MDPVTNVDRLVFVLRQRLSERARASKTRFGPRQKTIDVGSSHERDLIQALAGVDGVDDRHIRRALIQSVLADQIGPRVLNDAKFQQIIDNIAETIDNDAGASKLMAKLVKDLRAQAL